MKTNKELFDNLSRGAKAKVIKVFLDKQEQLEKMEQQLQNQQQSPEQETAEDQPTQQNPQSDLLDSNS